MSLRPISIIKEVLKLLRSTLPTTIEIHQLLMNLCTNAGHAMMKKGGVLEVSQCIMLMRSLSETIPISGPVAHLLLTINDAGGGMPPGHDCSFC